MRYHRFDQVPLMHDYIPVEFISIIRNKYHFNVYSLCDKLEFSSSNCCTKLFLHLFTRAGVQRGGEVVELVHYTTECSDF